ncbi:hypothetical protein TNCV_3486151 [Trichonephila clavipes]|nr:hypothetical protein TNCV_3486151 [Trichonephila clavipes]
MKHHSQASRIPSFDQSPLCHSAEWKAPLSPSPTSKTGHDMELRIVLQSRCPKKNAYSTPIFRQRPTNTHQRSIIFSHPHPFADTKRVNMDKVMKRKDFKPSPHYYALTTLNKFVFNTKHLEIVTSSNPSIFVLTKETSAKRNLDTCLQESARGLLTTDHLILNHGQETWTIPELAPLSPNYHTTPTGRRSSSPQI